MICGYLYHSSLINPLFSKLVSFSTNKKTNITVIFFFSKTFNSKNKFISTKNNQPINHKTNTIQKSLYQKDSKFSNSSIQPHSHNLLFVLWSINNQYNHSTRCYLNNLTHCNFASQQIRSFHNHIFHQNESQQHHAHKPFILSFICLSITSLFSSSAVSHSTKSQPSNTLRALLSKSYFKKHRIINQISNTIAQISLFATNTLFIPTTFNLNINFIIFNSNNNNDNSTFQYLWTNATQNHFYFTTILSLINNILLSNSIHSSIKQTTYQQPNPPIRQSILFIQFNNQHFAFSTHFSTTYFFVIDQ